MKTLLKKNKIQKESEKQFLNENLIRTFKILASNPEFSFISLTV